MKIAPFFLLVPFVCLVLHLDVTCAKNEMWIQDIAHMGQSSFHKHPKSYKVYRNVMDFGCRGDGHTDDTQCINHAISEGARCDQHCGSSTLTPALIYFPSGRYLISSPIIMYYFTQMVGNAKDRPVLLAAPNFSGIGVIDTDPYLPGGGQWYINQNNFFRQVRNFVIDLTQTNSTASTITAIHWQVAQATSLTNIHFKMSKQPGSGHQGIWMESGSGGFMSDLIFEGGKYGMWLGNQQFLSRNLIFNHCQTAIFINWNWQWTFKNVRINKCQVGIEMIVPHHLTATSTGSLLLLDSDILDTPTGILVKVTGGDGQKSIIDRSGTLLLDNVKVTNVTTTVADTNGSTLLQGGSKLTIGSWGHGSFYGDQSGKGIFKTGHLPLPVPKKSVILLDPQGKFFERSRPQYETHNISDFVNVKDFGATGDGLTDDSEAIQKVINESVDKKIVYFPAGSYILTKTIFVPPGTRLTGETWSVLMAHGPTFASAMKPVPMIKVGEPGQKGLVEISDIMFSVKGPNPGAILVEWNMAQSSRGSCGMWDTHFRVGGTAGSQLQVSECPQGQQDVEKCTAAFMLLHLTKQSSAYLENVWAWTADHDLDNEVAQGKISIYAGRGILIESQEGPVWLYGTQSEHNIFYQYQLSGAKNVFMTMIQSETPYWQPGPPAPEPFTTNSKFDDPAFTHCSNNSVTCPIAWGLRIVESSNVYIYGAGLYNFFQNYDQTCLKTEDCQDAMVSLEKNNEAVFIYNLNTKAAHKMVVVGGGDNGDGKVLALQSDNRNNFCSTINAFLVQGKFEEKSKSSSDSSAKLKCCGLVGRKYLFFVQWFILFIFWSGQNTS